MKKILNMFCLLLFVSNIAKAQTERYQPPQPLSPGKDIVLDKNKSKMPIIFRWTPLIPKGQEKILYKLTILEIDADQTPTQAAKVNSPVLEKEILDQTQTIVNMAELSRDLTKGQKMHFTWLVTAYSTKTNNPIENGRSELSSFALLSTADITITNFQVNCSATFGTYSYTLSVQNFGTASFLLNSLTMAPSITGLTIAPPLPVTIPASGTATFTGTFTYTGTTYPTMVYANVSGNEVGNPLLTSTDTDLDTLVACLCRDCDRMVINMDDITATPYGTNGDQYNLTGNLVVTGLPAYAVEMQVQSYDFTATPGSCTNGVTTIEQSGMILKPNTSINGSTTFLMLNETVSGSILTNNNAAKRIKLQSTTPLPTSIPYVLNIGLPSAISGLNNTCCRMQYTVCIKVRVFYDAARCNSCTYTKCVSFTN